MKNILIVVIGNTGNEPEALRQSLEYFGYFVAVKYIGRPNDFISVLKGDLIFDPDCVVISCHGENGEIIMPVLDENIYEADEPKGNMSANVKKMVYDYRRLTRPLKQMIKKQKCFRFLDENFCIQY